MRISHGKYVRLSCVNLRGFTMIELLVVMSIIVILVGLILAGVSAARVSNQVALTRVRMAKANELLEEFNRRYGTFPNVSLRWRKDITVGEDNKAAYLARNSNVMNVLMQSDGFIDELSGLGEDAFVINSIGANPQGNLYDAFDQPIRFDASVVLTNVSSGRNGVTNLSSNVVRANSYGRFGKMVVWSTGPNLEEDTDVASDSHPKLIYQDQTIDGIEYFQKRKTVLVPIGAPIGYAVPYCPDALQGDDIFLKEDTRR